ncbi:phage portal protein [Aurantimonas sp. VKM B-3413]|uniref:phage portal protein n=1 Tax=Aurantimonas sp. VKM B-3413 TaxID=2779401 RepID=UPI001E2E0E62|nr:phage portal protein [Aurantimonas sp. VKM B-3413]MCB8836105.1 phage portal protein [Aurantimonas sp. VKM B-3413]
MTIRNTIAAWLGRADTDARAETAEADRQAGRKSFAPPAGTLVFSGAGSDAWTERSYPALARTGFMQNPVVYRSVRMIAETAAAIPMLLYDGTAEIEDHPLIELLRRPNAATDGSGLVETLCGHLLLSGNAYLEAGMLAGEIRALHALRPDRVRVVEDRDGWPEAYEYRVGGSVRRIAAEGQGDKPAPLLHVRLFHPLADIAGYPPLAAAQTALDLHNAASRWNKSLLDNSARPSGALVYKPADGGNLAPDQFDRLKAELETGYAGSARAGRPMLLEGGLDWKAMALSPKDMDFVEARNGAARDIALAFGVPPMLLGIPGDATYSNYTEANRALYRLTVLPLLNRLCGAIGDWLGGHYGLPRLQLRADLDRVDGLSAEREALWARVSGVDFLSRDEKRQAVGYGTGR